MIKVLQGFWGYRSSGVTEYMLRNYMLMDKSLCQFDFIYLGDKPECSAVCEDSGASFFKLGRKVKLFNYINQFKRAIKESKCDILHLNISHADIFVILIAKYCGAKHIILHAHSTNIDEKTWLRRFTVGLVHRFSKPLLKYCKIDFFLACSNDAGRFIFGDSILKQDNYALALNGIDLNRFYYDKDIRNQMRAALGIEDNCFVLGHVGRFTYQKNHEFLIDVFEKFHEVHQDSILILVGEGDLFDDITKKIELNNLTDSVKLLGYRKDVECLLQAFDCMVLPSRFEGLCICAIEAQATGLPCVFANTLSKDTAVTESVDFVSLSADLKTWVQAVEKFVNYKRLDQKEVLRANGYDIEVSTKSNLKIYSKIVK